jgi:hypothetical protein
MRDDLPYVQTFRCSGERRDTFSYPKEMAEWQEQEKKQGEGERTWQKKDTRSSRNALNADVAL